MYNYQSNPNLTNCTFHCNFSQSSGGGIYNRMSNLELADCTFTENTGFSGGGMYSEDQCSLILMNCVFRANSAEWNGGGMCNEDANDLILTDCTFCDNSANPSGGGMYSRRSNQTLNNCIFSGNKAHGGPWPYTYPGKGGGLYAFGDARLINCTFTGNCAQQDRAISKYSFSVLRLSNCILWNGGNEISNSNPTTLVITYSDIQEGWEGEGNIDADPCFVDQGYWADANDPNIAVEPNDPNAVWVDGDYYLKSQAGRWDPVSESWIQDDVTSPCIDAGDPNSPIGHEPFPNGGIINMGAYGGTVEASKSYFGKPVCETIIAGDINGDCKVDFDDLMILMAHWLEDYTPQD
jgi:predicted outer membrane repeat protein